MAKKEYSMLPVVAFILSLLFFVPGLPAAGAILRAIALLKADGKKEGGRGLAIASVIIGTLVTAVQIIVIIFVLSFFGSMMEAFGGGNIAQGMDNCLKQQPGMGKDVCILMSLTMNINQTGSLDPNLCDDHVTFQEIRDFCNAILKKDKSYCYKIEDTQNRLKCIGLIDEMISAGKNQTLS